MSETNINIDETTMVKLKNDIKSSYGSLTNIQLANVDKKTTLTANKNSKLVIKSASDIINDVKKNAEALCKKIDTTWKEYKKFDESVKKKNEKKSDIVVKKTERK
ncbi:TIGR04197 family type VII secretion effector [Lachnobacterium bovis]|uniref:Type VII secretion effector, SACOL2603 family n=1 Tax=Lachnobacterium bovis TaxID=140626 RepID=A0A1H9UWF9_9FIRM|nr:TIGR04197 family type VII secretion effector [Lachnobacterium bovis]SES13454.1 type VII secretion effector, SACOL2603 family [Lachnobacterium bovis]